MANLFRSGNNINAIALGISLALIGYSFNKIRREKNHADNEVEQLKEKNRQMEELRKRTEDLEHYQRLETIGTMTSGIAHEFNNLLTPIMGYSLMTLEKLSPDEEIYDDVLEIYNASSKAKDIISRLSELSRKNTEKVFTEISPDVLVNKILSVASPMLPNRVDIIRRLNCRNRCIMGNETQLSQLLLNLIINAFQVMESASGTIIAETLAENGFIVFRIEDDGPGIPKDQQQVIFDPFFTTKESGKGTGLGLAIARQAVEDHGGRIELDSGLGRGSRFSVFLPEAEESRT